jgi:Fur family ferric uptake transcriptional regulator
MTRLLKRRQATLAPEVVTLTEALVAAGYKVTEPRLAVLKAAVACDGAFTAVDLEQWLAHAARSPGQVSIFRTLKLLTALGLLQRIHGVDECHRYTLCRGHAHRVVCTLCGRLVEFGDCGMDELAARVEQVTGFSIQGHLLEFFGRCPRCALPA